LKCSGYPREPKIPTVEVINIVSMERARFGLPLKLWRQRPISDQPSPRREGDAPAEPFKSLAAVIDVTRRSADRHGAIPTLGGCEGRLAEGWRC
jgi:hypothetical protein